ncbi:hypothetical protein BDW42DRAFT_190037 [Aspergillus taichungensis]|uniref:Uncharacterized protein n=1 Tax=Aspergillus taichungensis TaxID=482145 RepID=A0A2J5I9C4_9EURO|nr:hypothetical protein BDW42DRAFT_190037 [Aspergillus taichungensis]
MSEVSMNDSITSDPKEHVFYFVFYLPGTEECTFAMLKHCLKCLRSHQDVKVFTSKDEWDNYGEGARIGEIALEIATDNDDVDDACERAMSHIEKLMWCWAHTSEPSAEGFWVVVWSSDSDDDEESEAQKHVDRVDAELEACMQSLRLAKLDPTKEDLDATMTALDGWSMRE